MTTGKSENAIIFTEIERCILVGIAGREQSRWETEDHLDELESRFNKLVKHVGGYPKIN